MQVIPAIDLLGGKVVRLLKGRKETATVYSDDPLAVAQQFKDAGAKTIHVVDLDAAFGEGNNAQSINMIITCGVAVEVGGGIRNRKRACELVASGVKRIIIGTKAFDEEFLGQLLSDFSEKVAVSIDVLEGRCMIQGWQTKSSLDCNTFLNRLSRRGVRCVVYTDISRDGALRGANVEGLQALVKYPDMQFILSGGVSSCEELAMIKKRFPFIYGVIVGKALYEKKIDLRRAMKVVQ